MVMPTTRGKVLPRRIEEEMRESFLDYSMSVIVQRALPDVRDGLKPVHRRILYAMQELGLRPDRPYKKSATVVGEVLGKYHPHGDTAVYDALVRMAQDFSLRYPLVDGQGNFGSVDGDSAAAYRYTEARLAPAAVELLRDLDRDTVGFVPNFDDRLEEPEVLPGRLPNLLVNGSSGIAVGMSTNIPPHNLLEVASAIRLLADDPDCSVDDLLDRVPGPDFPTGGYVVGRDGIRDMYTTGRGRMTMQARVAQEALRGGKRQLVVTELPYAVSKTKVIEQIVALSRRGKIDDVTDVRDESDREGMRVVVELKRGADSSAVLETLFKGTHLRTTFGAILLALDGGEPREFNLKELLETYRDHRMEVVRRRARHDLEGARAELHVVEGLLAALDHIDEVIAIIRESEDRDAASERLQGRFKLSETQADAILNMRLARLTALEGRQLRDRKAELEAEIERLEAILGSEERQLEVVLEELSELVEAHGDERRTEIVEEAPEGQVVEDAHGDEEVAVTLSHEGYVSRMPMHLYQRRLKSGKPLAGMERHEDDYLERVFMARTSGRLLAFTEGGHCHFLPVLDVPEGGRSSRGRSLYGLLEADRNDRIVAVLPVEDLEAERFLLFATRDGFVKRTQLREFSNPRAGGVRAASVKEGDGILEVALSEGSGEVLMLTRNGRAIRFPEAEVSVMGRTARGVKGIQLEGDDQVVDMVPLRRSAWVLAVSEGALGKRTEVEEFPLQKRGGRGTRTLPSEDGDVRLVGAKEVVDGDEVSLVAASGVVHRLAVAEVPVQGRRTRGARLVALSKGDRVVELTRRAGANGDEGGPGGGGAGGSGVGDTSAHVPAVAGVADSGRGAADQDSGGAAADQDSGPADPDSGLRPSDQDRGSGAADPDPGPGASGPEPRDVRNPNGGDDASESSGGQLDLLGGGET